MGKFPIGEINRFLYMDINNAFQTIVNDTFDQKNLDKSGSAFIAFINNPKLFHLGEYSTEATINVPNRI